MDIKEIIRAPPGLEEFNKINEAIIEKEEEKREEEIKPTLKMRKLNSLGQLGGNEESNEEKYRTESLNKGFTKLEASRGRWETLLEVLGETRPADGRMGRGPSESLRMP